MKPPGSTIRDLNGVTVYYPIHLDTKQHACDTLDMKNTVTFEMNGVTVYYPIHLDTKQHACDTLDMKTPSTTPGIYNVFNAAGDYVSWYRNYKDAKHVAGVVGGKAVKVAAAPKVESAWTGDLLRLEDGTLVPFTRANIAKAGR
jgi:hypothetical protein